MEKEVIGNQHDMLSDFLAGIAKCQPPEFLIEDVLIRQRYLLLAGRTGIGKSLLGGQLTFCLATGKPWLGFQVKRCRALYLSFELSKFELGKRLKAQGNGYGLSDEFEPRICNRFFEPLKSLTELEDIITQGPMPSVVLVDSFRWIYRGRMNDNDEQARWIEQFQSIAIKYDIGFVLLQNTSKARPFLEVGAVEEAIGASELANRAVSVMVAVAEQKREAHGHYGSKASDSIQLHIPKYGCAQKQLTTRYLKLDRKTLFFKENQWRDR